MKQGCSVEYSHMKREAIIIFVKERNLRGSINAMLQMVNKQ